ncbi:putative RNA methyltransferase [Labedaea rhizosphaerae]|uniref:23S rRNA m(1)G-748 methyltransferase n=1 Tax=Labedaea rhizosphaerae TaxID=598644 RepID=A0A4R6SK80_LABRH|nr:methyltransferase domain-containing protein [Labedaea rhizosphaerae]TDQ04317.1 23S rRNA m(1)G-748 methyltransferase [Labedaea rhizosphaerae]
MLDVAVPYLRCPVCAAGLADAGGPLRCANGHSFDRAKQGYVSLLTGGKHPVGDTAEMVAARADFLAAGHYTPIVESLADVAPAHGAVLDIGAGTGYYLASLVDRVPESVGIAADASKFALRRAARAHARVGAIGCDAWQGLPVRTGSISLVLNVFAPRNGREMRRVLADDGRLVVVAPTRAHLGELVRALRLIEVDADKRQRIDQQLAPHLRPDGSTSCEFTLSLSRKDVHAVVGMGPSAWHVAEAALAERIAALPEPMTVTASVEVLTYRPG